MSDLIKPNIICFQTQKQLANLNNIQVLCKGVLIDLRAHNFVQAKTSLFAHCVHACHCGCNLLSPAFNGLGQIQQMILLYFVGQM